MAKSRRRPTRRPSCGHWGRALALQHLDLGVTYAELVERAADAVIVTDATGRVLLWNDAAEALFGRPREIMLGRSIAELAPQSFAVEFVRGMAAAFAAGPTRLPPLAFVAHDADGHDLTVEAAIAILESGAGLRAIASVRCLSERFNDLHRLREGARRLREAEQLAGMGSFEWMVGSDEITWSDQLARIYGYEPGNHPTTLAAFLERVHPDDRESVQRQIGQALADGSSWSMEERIIRADTGETRILASHVKSLCDAQGRVVRLCGICHDVTEQRHAEEALAAAEARARHGALHDALTGLPNRELLLDRLSSALGRAQRERTVVAVLLVDIDNFKLINDTIGHRAGDEILRTVAQRLLACARSSDTAARIGGDQFAIVCEGVANDDETPRFATRIAATLAAPLTIGTSEFITTVSIGIALGRGGEPPEQLLRDADLALHRAKQQGKNRIEFFDELLRRHAFDRMEVERDLRRALRDDEIVPYYQPIVELESGRIVGFEALARWHHPERGLLLPAQFLSVAEETHMIAPLGAAVLRAACRQLAHWRASRPSLTMAVNLSLRELDANFVRTVDATLREFGIEPRALHVEVTESVLLDLQKSAASRLNELAGLGVQLGIDDFGTGYSSLLYLKRFPVRFVKIDRSFVASLPADQDRAIVGAIVQLGRSLGLTTIAEGVESAEQFSTLHELGCGRAQGYYIARPMPAIEGTAALEKAG